MSIVDKRCLGPLGLLGLLGLSACAASPEQAERAEARDEKFAMEPEPAGQPDAPVAEAAEAPRELEDYQRELANNRAALTQLGVRFDTDEDNQLVETTTTVDRSENEQTKPGKTSSKTKASKKGTAGGGLVRPGSVQPQPSQPPMSEPNGGGGRKADQPKPAEKSKPGDKAPDDSLALDEAKPDEAKAVQGPPVGSTPEPDAAERCESICSLGQVTCALQEQICELAERHPDEEDYQSACERAVGDCEIAKEACDGCQG